MIKHMGEGKSYTIHKSKKSQVDKELTARESLIKALESTAHRMESLGEIEGVEFINDARAADLLSTRDTFKCMMKPAVWLSATTVHERDYALIEKYVKYKIKAIVVYGGEGADMREKLNHLVDDFHAGESLKEAVTICKNIADEGDVVVFSPSCLPEDEFRNFVDRGDAFKIYVDELK
jgi:UDP-N-acetylmuramoylalanine--D-glutamate ligase